MQKYNPDCECCKMHNDELGAFARYYEELDAIKTLKKENLELREALSELYILYTEQWMANDLYMQNLTRILGKDWKGRKAELLKYIQSLQGLESEEENE